jgi:hypothetical protein
MATLVIPITLDWGYGHGSPGANVWHVRTTGAPGSGGELEGLVEMLQDFYTSIAGLFNATTTIRFEGEANGVGDDVGSYATAPPWTVTGTDAGSVAPPVLAMLVQWRAQSGGRNGRGRTFLGPLAASAVESNGTPSETARAAVQSAADDLIESSDSFANGAFVVYSRTENVARDFITASVPNDFAVLRSRRD